MSLLKFIATLLC